ncbi:class D beta-lactamase [Thalassotalea euphylliae]|uniref:Beta-lactamase n=1 Tax=Thalassotalea euphylliae TaxID=1655234 RepID=A0A3E0TY52_9GAMM|nr:class D beta-lactamase [Thalassotalea euphylliae]REL29327.1 class D beta-lactamase [Thalassotalea euphylliae]
MTIKMEKLRKALSSVALSTVVYLTGVNATVAAPEKANTPASLPCEQADSKCAFVLLTAEDKLIVRNKQWADTRFSPFSTFKIPNSLIALDLGIVRDLEQTMRADTTTYPPEKWWPSSWTAGEHTLRSAYQVSNVPIYRAIATQVGSERMKNYLNAFDYGNRDISAGLDLFWLGVSLQISPIEQVQFLQRLYTKQLPLKASTFELLKPLMLNHDTPDYKIYGKTGAGTFSPTMAQGWFVGVVEKGGQYHYFAAHSESTTFKHVIKHRKDIARAYLAHYQLPHTIQ